ncbi:MAG TPA: nucleotidyltransferase family protein [Candidatus Bathyarchaeia archaeon]|nr:nucleotidyltransferase family protein [Candidatus Bathyarchaeia archaeon]
MNQESKMLKEIEKILNENKEVLTKQFKVKEIGIFGSIVRGEDKETSDVDILVEFKEPIGLFKFLELEEYLSDLIGKKVDLVSKKALKPRIGKHILREVAFL